jgi:hypothetical protein
MIFRWVVRHMRWLAPIPGAPHLFDSVLLMVTVLFDRERLAVMDQFEQRALNSGIALGVHRLGGVAFMAAKREVGHLHGNGLLDLKVGNARRAELIEGGQAQPHHVFPNSPWVSFWLRNLSDLERAWDLFQIALSRAVPR